MNKYMKMTRDGFTLVELMIVVAIIGVLASIAVPQYSKFQAKSRQSEVRIQLGAAYTVEQSFAAENSTYTACLGQVGYNRDGTKFYYSIGFDPAAATASTTCAPGAAAGTCLNYQWFYDATTAKYTQTPTPTVCTAVNLSTQFDANISEPSSVAGLVSAIDKPTVGGDLKAATTAVSSTAFTIGGGGKVLAKAGNIDFWTIDNNKQILNIKSGLN